MTQHTGPTYITTHTTSNLPRKAILLSDLFGLCTNTTLVADDFARAGYFKIVESSLQHDALPLNVFSDQAFDVMKWAQAHGPKNVLPMVEETIQNLREVNGTESVGGVDY